MQFWRRPLLSLVAALASAGAALAQGAAPPQGDTAAAGAGLLPGLGLKLQRAPVITAGSVSYDLRASRTLGEHESVAHLVTARLRAETYIYQPWFATLSGTLGLTASRSSDVGQSAAFGEALALSQRLVAKERFLTGDARLTVFPKSRFPFEVQVDRSDSRVDHTLASALDFRTQGLVLMQRYQPPSGAYTLSGKFDRREQVAGGARDVQNALAGDLSTHWLHHTLALGLSLSQARRQARDDRTQFRSLVARHNYTPAPAWSVNTTLNWTQTEERADALASDVSVLQATSVALWQPERSRLRLTGSTRALVVRESVTGQDLASLGLTLGGHYQLNRNLQFTANGSLTATTTDGSSTQGFSGAVNASWQGDTIGVGKLRYDWFVGSNATLSSSAGAQADSGETLTTVGVQAGHTVSRNWSLARQSQFTLTGGQTLAVAHNGSSAGEEGNTSRTLLHNTAATWSASGDGRSAYARASYSDSVELGDSSRFQLGNFQLSGKFDFNRYRSLEGDITLQHTRQRTGRSQLLDTPDGPARPERLSTSGAAGQIIFRHQRLFGFPRLRFTSRLSLAQDVLRQPGTFASIPDRETRQWENRLDWSVGRLQSQLVLRLSEIEGKRQQFLWWRVQRNFGD